MFKYTPENTNLIASDARAGARAWAMLTAEDAALRRTLGADDSIESITFAYLPDQRPEDEYEEYLETVDAEWPEVQRHPAMPHPYYIAQATKGGGFDVTARLMDPRFYTTDLPGEGVRFMNTLSYSVNPGLLSLGAMESVAFVTYQGEHFIEKSGVSGVGILQGITSSLKVLRRAYPDGMHGFWDLQEKAVAGVPVLE
jgi:hypothetical protein